MDTIELRESLFALDLQARLLIEELRSIFLAGRQDDQEVEAIIDQQVELVELVEVYNHLISRAVESLASSLGKDNAETRTLLPGLH